MSADGSELPTLVYEYLNRSTDPLASAAGDDRSSWVHPSVSVNERGDDLVERLLAAERRPGEVFEAVLNPSPETVTPAFIADTAVQYDDVVGFAAPSSQLYDDLFYAVYEAMAETGAVLTTKYPRHEVYGRLSAMDPLVIDSTPGAEADGGVDIATSDAGSVRCGDLTSLGVAAERATMRLVTDDRPGTFAIATMTQLLAHHDARTLDKFLHELVGQWRNQGVGGLVHLPPTTDVDGADRFGAAHLDYVIEMRTGDGQIEARVSGKQDVAPTWQVVGSAPCSDSEASVRLVDRQLSGTADEGGGESTSE
ncbi:hypothetical protein [Halorubrum sp. Hd13]|uniref:DUF7504 family protein n=1 Tax=Halorubrum sp. Hd13 TaxID=1480728 RepID=UPI000B99178D|nr:hypothetical protein [Halorubrum sp. Hd13]OYR44566.1 hypothetical protein DJ81_07075 [Halorubrum sp. Hd13]